jgi:AraC-like DNA-binding protein
LSWVGLAVSPKFQLAISFLQANLHRTITIADIAHVVELSPSRLSYLFKTQVGVSPFQYLKRARLERARELLETSFLSVKVIAAEVGYNDCTHFMRDSKKLTVRGLLNTGRSILLAWQTRRRQKVGVLASKQEISLVLSSCIVAAFGICFTKIFGS